MIQHDGRKLKMNLRTINDHGELEIVKQILEMNDSQQQVTYQTVIKIAIDQWKREDTMTKKKKIHSVLVMVGFVFSWRGMVFHHNSFINCS